MAGRFEIFSGILNFLPALLSVETIAGSFFLRKHPPPQRERQRSLAPILWLSLIADRKRPLPFLYGRLPVFGRSHFLTCLV